jgi:hypothetical protein
VRPFIRELTHTLQLPPAHAEIYGGPHAEWLRDCLEYLPHLQCLLVNGLPFFDHASLLCLRHASLRQRPNHPLTYPVFGLRLLDASGCTNATSTGLAEALCHLPNLVSLDLSQISAAKDNTVLSKLQLLGNLRLLSLKGLGLKDADFDIIAASIGTRVRSLDVSNNHLTDASARTLLHHCLKEESVEPRVRRGPLPPIQDERIDSDFDTLSENVESHVRRKLTGGFVGSLAIESARGVGITHLYLSKNAITVEGISGLLRSRRLEILDVGILPTVLERPYSNAAGEVNEIIELPSVSKLTPIISEYASSKLKYLRINHQIVTDDAPLEIAVSPRAELDGDLGHYVPPNALELEATDTSTSELDNVDTVIYEVPGSPSYPVELPGCLPTTSRQAHAASSPEFSNSSQEVSVENPSTKVTEDSEQVKPGAESAPEPVKLHYPHTPTGPLQQYQKRDAPSSYSLGQSSVLLSPTALSDGFGIRHSSMQSTENRSRPNSPYHVEDRRARLEFRQSQENRLHPSMLPKVHTLVLTDVPMSTSNMGVIDRIIQYIKDAAEDASIARQRAEHTYALPPGRSRAIAEREHAHSLFAFRRLVLEMAPPKVAAKKVSSSWRSYPTKSSTEDADSEAFWEAATQDFSFFGEEECGLPDAEPGRTLPLEAMSGLELASEQPEVPLQPRNTVEFQPLLDVVGEIAKFRKEKKAVYNNLVQLGVANPDVDGYWPGDVTVVRNAVNEESGELDCYGNRYESGWYYR